MSPNVKKSLTPPSYWRIISHRYHQYQYELTKQMAHSSPIHLASVHNRFSNAFSHSRAKRACLAASLKSTRRFMENGPKDKKFTSYSYFPFQNHQKTFSRPHAHSVLWDEIYFPILPTEQRVPVYHTQTSPRDSIRAGVYR